jgi:cell division septation protein DedD
MTASPYNQPAPASSRSRRRLWIILGSIGACLILCCAGLVILGAIIGPPTPAPRPAAAESASTSGPSPSPTPSPTTVAAPSPAPSGAAPTPIASSPTPAAPPDREICQVTDHGGSYYLYVTSAQAHNFQACAGAKTYNGTIDQLVLSNSTMDRRCILGDAYTAAHQAIVGVYSDTRSADLAAAQQFCAANGGTQ